MGVLSDTSVGATNACFRVETDWFWGGGIVGNAHNRGGCATTTTNTAHNQEWLCHNVAELGAVLVVLGGGYLGLGICTARSRCATTTVPQRMFHNRGGALQSARPISPTVFFRHECRRYKRQTNLDRAARTARRGRVVGVARTSTCL
jgi:hypothetical protein